MSGTATTNDTNTSQGGADGGETSGDLINTGNGSDGSGDLVNTDSGSPGGSGEPGQGKNQGDGKGKGDGAGDSSEGGKPEDQARAPEAYELTVPEGTEFSDDDRKDVEDFARELDLTNDQAQKLLEEISKSRAATAEAQAQQLQDTHKAAVESWKQEVRKHPELGGEKLEGTLRDAERGVQLVPESFRDLAKKSGYINHPAVVEMLSWLGRVAGEDGLASGSDAANTEPLSREQRLYGDKQ